MVFLYQPPQMSSSADLDQPSKECRFLSSFLVLNARSSKVSATALCPQLQTRTEKSLIEQRPSDSYTRRDSIRSTETFSRRSKTNHSLVETIGGRRDHLRRVGFDGEPRDLIKPLPIVRPFRLALPRNFFYIETSTTRRPLLVLTLDAWR